MRAGMNQALMEPLRPRQVITARGRTGRGTMASTAALIASTAARIASMTARTASTTVTRAQKVGSAWQRLTTADDSLLGRLKKKLCGDGAEGPDAKQ
eukprot:m.21952 g.21952  ORF g.21952 m.21952 type:complete len:97 (+) comp3688_c0_seq1:1254-1544(+)